MIQLSEDESKLLKSVASGLESREIAVRDGLPSEIERWLQCALCCPDPELNLIAGRTLMAAGAFQAADGRPWRKSPAERLIEWLGGDAAAWTMPHGKGNGSQQPVQWFGGPDTAKGFAHRVAVADALRRAQFTKSEAQDFAECIKRLLPDAWSNQLGHELCKSCLRTALRLLNKLPEASRTPPPGSVSIV